MADILRGTFTIRSTARALHLYAAVTGSDEADALACKLTVLLDTLEESAHATVLLDNDEDDIARAAMIATRD
jgi:hypothetical protein